MWSWYVKTSGLKDMVGLDRLSLGWFTARIYKELDECRERMCSKMGNRNLTGTLWWVQAVCRRMVGSSSLTVIAT